MNTVGSSSDYKDLDRFTLQLLEESPLTPAELLLLSFGSPLELLPSVTSAGLIAKIASQAGGALDYEARVSYLTQHFSRLVGENYRKQLSTGQ